MASWFFTRNHHASVPPATNDQTPATEAGSSTSQAASPSMVVDDRSPTMEAESRSASPAPTPLSLDDKQGPTPEAESSTSTSNSQAATNLTAAVQANNPAPQQLFAGDGYVVPENPTVEDMWALGLSPTNWIPHPLPPITAKWPGPGPKPPKKKNPHALPDIPKEIKHLAVKMANGEAAVMSLEEIDKFQMKCDLETAKLVWGHFPDSLEAREARRIKKLPKKEYDICVPPLLKDYLGPPKEKSLGMITNDTEGQANWLALKYVQSIIGEPLVEYQQPKDDAGFSVIVVSFSEPLETWEEGMKKMGYNVELEGNQSRFGFVDGFMGMLERDRLKPQNDLQSGWYRSTTTAEAAEITERTFELMAQMADKGRKVVLLFELIDFAVGAQGFEIDDHNNALKIWHDMIMEVRESSHSTILTFDSANPLGDTPLDKTVNAFQINYMYEASKIFSCRELPTGPAEDVTAILRIRDGGFSNTTGDKEYLYHIGVTGSVRVFEKGQ
ncbi:hypothetical protein QBC38DRAFT_463728 [Podospora fimiseda]|uniref:Uncharacterized protein n=1 Tax=Podospora fimiseda TaxID=252190 RepID=A0AAN7BZ52_9PEZI|nr:hypothetical protein QBC38DRAFT_463728 [Podospora fimiseda]